MAQSTGPGNRIRKALALGSGVRSACAVHGFGRFARTVALFLVFTGLAGCGPVRYLRSLIDPADRMAARVTIIRDTWGVPHIYGPTDGSVVFGLGYAQAEDNFWQIEDDYLFALGRAAAVYGSAELANDMVRAAFDVERLSRAEYDREPPERKAVWNAFAAGINYYLRTHSEVRPRLLRRFEPWFPFARFRSASAGSTVDGVRLRDVVAERIDTGTGESAPPMAAGTLTANGGGTDPGTNDGTSGSNAWAVAPARTRSGAALLFQNPHSPFFGRSQRYEMHIESESGWHVSGFAILGTPMPRSGHNEQLGWVLTNTGADDADAFLLTFGHPTDPLAYRSGPDWRQATSHEAEIAVRTPQGTERRRYRFLRTHHGPVVQAPDGLRYAVRRARFEDGGSLQQWYAMGKATSLEEFRAALAATAFPNSNTTYADRDGNIMYVHGNAVPRRDSRFDWSRPVDAADPATEWQGYHELHELPQLVNPPAGWLQNTNATPFRASADGSNPDPADYPSYMAPESDNARARASRRILSGRDDWTFEAWSEAAFDTYVNEADSVIDLIIDEWERLGATDPDRVSRVDEAVMALQSWDQVSTVESTAMTYFMLWTERIAEARRSPDPWPAVRALEDVMDWLERTWGRTAVPWGEINRLQRIHTSGRVPFDNNAPSLAVPGGPGGIGIIFNFGTRPGPEGRRRYGTRGHSWVGVVEFGPRVQARSIVNFGQSADSASVHWFDQAALYARGELKPALFYRTEVEASAVRRYRPGR